MYTEGGIKKTRKSGTLLIMGQLSCSMAKWRLQLDSAHQLGLSTLCTGILIVVDWHRWGSGIKKRKNGRRFWSWTNNQRSYGQMETKVGFSASNRSIYTLHRESNCSWWTHMGSRDQKTRKSGTFLIMDQQPAIVWPNGDHGWIHRIE